jgi:hypothetical protein
MHIAPNHQTIFPHIGNLGRSIATPIDQEPKESTIEWYERQKQANQPIDPKFMSMVIGLKVIKWVETK